MSNLWAALQTLEMLPFPGKAVESQPLLGATGGGCLIKEAWAGRGKGTWFRPQVQLYAFEHISKSDSSSATSQHWQDNQRR